jgi:hypothetical protein
VPTQLNSGHSVNFSLLSVKPFARKRCSRLPTDRLHGRSSCLIASLTNLIRTWWVAPGARCTCLSMARDAQVLGRLRGSSLAVSTRHRVPASLYKGIRQTRQTIADQLSMNHVNAVVMSRQSVSGLRASSSSCWTTGRDTSFVSALSPSVCRRIALCVMLFVTLNCLQVPSPVDAVSSLKVDRRRPTMVNNDEDEILTGMSHMLFITWLCKQYACVFPRAR